MENENKKNFDKARKKAIKKYTTWGLMALLVLVLAAMPLLAKSEAEEDGPVASILSGTVENGSITTALKGGGTLSADNAQDVTLPASVKITEFLVKNGQEVTEGTPVAAVDPVSVMTAIVEVTDTMELLQKQIESSRNEKVSSHVSATAGGRVKAVYAEAGDSVQEVMLRDGALAVLSLDGLMAVELEQKQQIRTGDSVTVTLADGTQVAGRVDSNLDGIVTVTVEDEGYEAGQQVTVTTEDGTPVGTGELYIHSSWKATAFTGTVSAVYAKEESTVYSGATLFTLTDTEITAQMETLANQHREYEELLQDLCKMYDSGVITAPCDGTISGIDRDSAHLLAAEESEYEVELLDGTTEGSWSILLLSQTEPVCTCDENCPLPHDSQLHLEGCIQACDKTTTCDATKHHLSCIKSCDHADKAEDCDATGVHYSDCIRSCAAAAAEGECTSQKHYVNCIESCVIGDTSVPCPATGAHHTDCIKLCDLTENCPGTKNHYAGCVTHCDSSLECDALNHKADCPLYSITYTARAAKVTAYGNELVVLLDPVTEYPVEATKNGWALADSAALRTDLMLYETTIQPSNKVSCNPGDIILILTGTDGNGDVVVSGRVIVYRKSAEGSQGSGGMGGMSGLAGMMSGLMGGFGGYGGYGGAAAQGPALFPLDGDVLMTVTPRDTVSLTISIDEQDISKIRPGQAAQVKVEALKGQTFEAEVTEVATTGNNSGGSSKFTVKLELTMAEDMLDGMSAAATIPLYTKMDILTIPVKALAEDGAKTLVYTALDKETGEPAAPVEVQIGISDGETAEVISGLNSGDTFYYSYYDTLELDTSAESRFGF